MPTLFTDYKPTNSEHILPNEAVSKYFQYRHYINWSVPGGNNSLMKNGTGSWQIQLIAPNGHIIFEQEVELTVTIVNAGFSVIWYQHESGEKIVTTIVNNREVTEDNPAWKDTLGAGEFSEQGYMNPGGGEVASFGTLGGEINAFWESPVYRGSIPVGTRLNVIFDHWGLGVSLRPEWQFRFTKGTDNAAAYFDETTGMTWQGIINNGQTFIRNTRRMRSGVVPEFEVLVSDETATYTKVMRSHSAILVLMDVGKVLLSASEDDGQTWKSIMESDLNLEILASAIAADGGKIYLYGKDKDTSKPIAAALAHKNNKFVMSTKIDATFKDDGQQQAEIEKMPTSNITGLECSKGSLLLSVNDDGKMEIYISTDEGATWEALSAS